MTRPFRFTDVTDPALVIGARRTWRDLDVVRVTASAGRHAGGMSGEHRVIFYLSGGVTAECGCEGLAQRRTQAPCDFDLVPAGAVGFWEDSGPVEMLSVRLSSGLADSMAQALETPGGRAALAPRLGARDRLVSHVAQALLAELEAPAGGRLYADTLASALLVRLLQDAGPGRAPRRQTLSKPQMKRILDHVEANLSEDLGLAEIAEVAGISTPHLTSLFRRTMGQSVHAYVMERRTVRARDLLLSGRIGIAEASAEAGFAHPSHLARWMRRLTGAAPSEVLAVAPRKQAARS